MKILNQSNSIARTVHNTTQNVLLNKIKNIWKRLQSGIYTITNESSYNSSQNVLTSEEKREARNAMWEKYLIHQKLANDSIYQFPTNNEPIYQFPTNNEPIYQIPMNNGAIDEPMYKEIKNESIYVPMDGQSLYENMESIYETPISNKAVDEPIYEEIKDESIYVPMDGQPLYENMESIYETPISNKAVDEPIYEEIDEKTSASDINPASTPPLLPLRIQGFDPSIFFIKNILREIA